MSYQLTRRSIKLISVSAGALMKDQQEMASPALDVALAYHRAWTGKNVDQPCVTTDDIVCDAPAGQMRGIDQYRPFLANFVPLVTGYDMIAALGDSETAVLVYDLHTI